MADDSLPVRIQAPLRPTIHTIACPAGLKVGTNSEGMMACSSSGVLGAERLTSPMIRVHPNGVRASEGVLVNGAREGLWVFYDVSGNKIKEIQFKNDHYDGTYVKYEGGRKTLEETYVAGSRQGDQRTWDAAGNLTVVRYVDDHPVATK